MSDAVTSNLVADAFAFEAWWNEVNRASFVVAYGPDEPYRETWGAGHKKYARDGWMARAALQGETKAEYCPIHPDVQIVVRPSTSVNGGSIGWGCAVCNCLEVERLRGFVSDEERSASIDRARNRRAVKSSEQPTAPAATSLASKVPASSTGTAAGAVPTCTKHGVALAFDGDVCWACQEEA